MKKKIIKDTSKKVEKITPREIIIEAEEERASEEARIERTK